MSDSMKEQLKQLIDAHPYIFVAVADHLEHPEAVYLPDGNLKKAPEISVQANFQTYQQMSLLGVVLANLILHQGVDPEAAHKMVDIVAEGGIQATRTAFSDEFDDIQVYPEDDYEEEWGPPDV